MLSVPAASLSFSHSAIITVLVALVGFPTLAAPLSTRSRLAARIAQARGKPAVGKGATRPVTASTSLSSRLASRAASRVPIKEAPVVAAPPLAAVRRAPVRVQRRATVQTRDLSELRKLFVAEQEALHAHLRQLDMESANSLLSFALE